MCGRSTSKSTSKTDVQNKDHRAVGDNGSTVVSGGDRSQFNIDAVPDEVLEFTGDAISGAYNLVGQSLSLANMSTSNAVAAAVEQRVSTTSPAEERDNRMIYVAAILGAAYVATKL